MDAHTLRIKAKLITGVKITEGLDTPDIHATLLCTWANIMILETIGQLDENFKTLKQIFSNIRIDFIHIRKSLHGLNVFTLRLGEILIGISAFFIYFLVKDLVNFKNL